MQSTAEAAGLLAHPDAAQVPFLVMCGTLDSRYAIALAFAESLKQSGFVVEWPEFPHNDSSSLYEAEFAKFPAHAVRFFKTYIACEKIPFPSRPSRLCDRPLAHSKFYGRFGPGSSWVGGDGLFDLVAGTEKGDMIPAGERQI